MTKKHVGIIFTVWLGFLTVIFLLQKLYPVLGFGYHIWPLGEERNWLEMIIDAPSAQMVRSFWALDGRNPLSAWFWYLASPLILKSNWAIYLLGLLVNLFLSTSMFLFLNRFGQGKSSIFALSVSLLTVVWNFSIRFDNCPLNNTIAIAFTLLSLYFYCKFIDENRQDSKQILLSLLCYFVALTTYTLQPAAFLGIFFISLMRSQDSFKSKIINSFFDAGCFFCFFILYNLIWFETSPFPSATSFSLSFSLISQLIDSLDKFIFPPTLKLFYSLFHAHWSFGKTFLVFSLSLSAFLLTLLNPATKRLFEGKMTSVPYLGAGLLLLIISLPTILVESTSNIFVPGDRSYFSIQVFLPVLYSMIIFAVFNFLFKSKSKLPILIGISIFGAIILTTTFLYNNIQMQKTFFQMKLAKEINNLNLPLDKRTNVLVKVNRQKNTWVGTEISARLSYSNTVFKKRNVFIKLIEDAPEPKSYEGRWKLIFDEEGVKNSNAFQEIDSKVPYTNILIVYYDGDLFEVPKVVDKSFFDGLQVEWNRKEPLLQVG